LNFEYFDFELYEKSAPGRRMIHREKDELV